MFEVVKHRIHVLKTLYTTDIKYSYEKKTLVLDVLKCTECHSAVNCKVLELLSNEKKS